MIALSISRRWVCLVAVASAFAVVGCGEGDGYTGPRGRVSGGLTLDGTPLPSGCSVVFIEERHGYLATGIVGDGGTYTLRYGKGSDLPVGNYKVQLSPPLSGTTEQSTDPVAQAARMKLGPKSASTPAVSLPFPKRYLSTANSGLTFTVAPGQNTADLPLSSKDVASKDK